MPCSVSSSKNLKARRWPEFLRIAFSGRLTIPAPYARGYLYGSSSYALADAPYPANLIAAARAGTLKPNDDTRQNPSYALAAGGVISTADDLATWMRALVGGKILDADYQRRWLDSPEPEDPSKPLGQKYGYGITQLTFGANSLYFHGGEMPGYNSFMGYDPVNGVTLIVWINLTISLDGQLPANSIMLKMLDRIYMVSPLQQSR
jgi:D-alanyl-D-alanine carboxypeptidase